MTPRSLLAVVMVAFALAGTGAKRPDWTCYPILKEGGSFTVESRSPESFVIHATRTNEKVVKTGVLAIANINREMWTHHRLVMNVRSLNGKRVNVGATVSHPDGAGKTTMSSAPGFEVSGRAWRQIVLGLDSDFGFGDCNMRIGQLKIGAWIGHWRSGEEGGLEVSGVRFVGPNEIAASSAMRTGDTFVSVPSRPLRRPRVAAGAIKVFFAFDNEDLSDSFSVRRKFFDAQQYGGFREKLLEHLDGQAIVTTSLAEADVLVYARCRPDPQVAAQIVAAVRERGIPLYAAGEVCDPAVEELLPCRLSHEPPEDLPPRQRVVFVQGDCPLARKGPLNDAAFGVYRTVTPRPGAKKLLQFADGTPALLEGTAGRGRVMYNMIGIGSSLVCGKDSPDAFFVRALGELTGRDFPERTREPLFRTVDGWQEGLGSNGGFGRFGWEVGSGLLVDALGANLTVRRDACQYEFAVPRTGNAARRVTFAGDRADPLSLGGEVTVDGAKAYRVDMSLAYPGVRWQFRRKDIEMHLANLNGFAYVPVGKGKVLDLSREEIPAEGWTEPWMLLFNGSEKDAPLMVVLQRRPGRIEVMRQGEAVAGLRFVAAGDTLGMIVPTWIYGCATCDTSGWETGISVEALRRARWWHPHALAYPIRCRESFRVDRARGRVEIKTRYGYARATNEWGTVPRDYAAISPVAWTMKGTLFETDDEVVPTGLVTGLGDFAVKDGAREVQWRLKLFDPDLSFVPHVRGFERFESVANDHFAHGVKFTCGGGIKVDYAKDKQSYAAGRCSEAYNCNMHGMLLGMVRAAENPFIYSEENRRLLRRRLTWRMLEPLETMQYKMVCRWRCEPVSGTDYTIYMNSPREIAAVYEPATYGSKIIYGDSNETVMMICTSLQQLADRLGQTDVVKANWDAISRHVPSFPLANDDWGIMASGCLEWGGSGSIDMLNCEASGMLRLARLAEIAGDDALRDQALYRAARRACPTLARLRMHDYFTRHGLFTDPKAFRAAVGYNEAGACFQARNRPVKDIDLFEMSQGIPRDLISLYDWYGWTELRRDYLPYVRKADETSGLNYAMTAILALGDDLPAKELESRLDRCVANAKLDRQLKRDWPGMNTGTFLAYALQRLAQAPLITDCRDVYLHEAVYDPATRNLQLDVTPGAHGVLSVDYQNVTLGPAGQRRQFSVKVGNRK